MLGDTQEIIQINVILINIDNEEYNYNYFTKIIAHTY